MHLNQNLSDYFITCDTASLINEITTIHALLRDCYWSKDIPIKHVEKFLHHSLCFGIFYKTNSSLIGFGRVITDYTTYAYVCDIIIDIAHRKIGLGDALIKTMMNHAELQGLKTWSLKTTNEAKKLYLANGFKAVTNPESQFEIDDIEIYARSVLRK